jgi:protein phosphatase 2C-like protein
VHATVWSQLIQKAGNSPTECEDAVYPRATQQDDLETLRVAVADGATEAFRSGPWADLLVRVYCHGVDNVDDLLARADRRWQRLTGRMTRERQQSGPPLQWYEESRLAEGSYAALVGLELRSSSAGDGTWNGMALGDSCVFQVRDDDLRVAWPVEDPDAFGYTPELVPSRMPDPGKIAQHFLLADGHWAPGDKFYLATDALSHWFLEQHTRDHKPWRELDERAEDFEAWVDSRRDDKSLRNDDVALLRVTLG